MAFFGKKSGAEKSDEPRAVQPEPEPTLPPASGATPTGPRIAFGIEDAIRLMRTLPTDQHIDLVVHVIKNTLESMNVRVGDILTDASQKQQVLAGRIKDLNSEIADLEKQAGTRRNEIVQLEKELAEMTTVKDRLAHAEPGAKGKSPPPASE